MRILHLDVETSPNVGDVWRLFKQTITIDQLRESSRVICYAARWDHERGSKFFSEWQHGADEMIGEAYNLIEEADLICGWNTIDFDIRHLHKEFYLRDWQPPAPAKHMDLLRTARRRFAFPSNKLDYVAQVSGVGRKVKHEGHELWVKVLQGDPAAQKRMERYNRRDVNLLPPLLDKLRPWLVGAPNQRLYAQVDGDVDQGCPHCGGQLHRNGFDYQITGAYQRYKCSECGAPSRATRRSYGASVRPVAY